ncbi:uncharacterized protein NECHADRAFT_82040 [Fusarium vanettenii 77-13-4]|uniref:Heterokaryon incompatibility domain-containing protein n=1 Tax=Fusarium vanettenii (strain ATCC MYA-4622 / CBS 123669 / FGSC 9596 / NRRL 45880 / 77-13-4) TaxID=660122 RepID=C7ZAB4_FUSV7|nr:uncharacterized protein NECHADRAFT_82040 [Fusarium vanettenii 77-13-4]EEU39648.1 hypothetical protein NECHADRAFT_82040 [Fusarium vanettenii 77-13-4]
MPESPGATASDQSVTLECKFCQAFLEAAEEVRTLNEKKLAAPSEYTRERRTWKLEAAEVYNGCQVHLGFPEALLKLNVDLNAMDYSIKNHTGVQLSILRAPQLLLINDLSHNPSIPLERPLDHFIDPALILKWKRDCNKYHGSKCQDKSTRLRRPLSFLIDTKQMCLVEPADGMEYVALSYVWGQAPMLKTTRANIDLLRQHHSLERLGSQIPTTIMDSIKLVPLLEERYLWIDSLCIIQDDPVSCGQQINQMAAIYDNATLVLVAVDGQDAEAGLRGLSRPRLLKPILQLTPETRFTVKGLPYRATAPWTTRGWAFQESIFARRKITFYDNTVRWTCQCCTFSEDIDEAPDKAGSAPLLQAYGNSLQTFNALELSRAPNLRLFADLISIYNQRSLTFEEDVMNAISSTFSVMQQAFPRGFIYGLPVYFFDTFLAWHALNCGLRRRKGARQDTACPPSWTWAGWKGRLAGGVRRRLNQPNAISRVIPTLTWYTSETPKSPGRLIPSQNDAYHYKTRFMGEKDNLPKGWKWCRGDYYEHKSFPKVEFRHPVPIGGPGDDQTEEISYGRYLCAETHQQGCKLLFLLKIIIILMVS